ncbi:MAG: RDD family protein [Bacteroidota bacterium]
MHKTFASLPDRVKGAVIDGLLLIGLMYGASELLALFDGVPTFVRVIIAVIVFVLYDPIFTHLYGGTIGHSFSGIEVRRLDDQQRHLSFPKALFRFIFKASLGWLSLLTVTGNDKKQAIHDQVAGSVVYEELKEEDPKTDRSEDG